MKHTLSVFLSFIISIYSFGQSGIQKQIEQANTEGLILYHLEKASWEGTDILYNHFPNKKAQIGGYFSYQLGEKYICVFTDKNNDNSTSLTISFNETINVETAIIDTSSRQLSIEEKSIFELRNSAVHFMKNGNQIKFYENTNFNIIPIIKGKTKLVYIITASTVNKQMILGNDYLLTFNKKNKIKKVNQIHNDIFVYNEQDENEWSNHIHSENNNPCMTATDVCTLLLYGDRNSIWHHHLVKSKEYVSIWDYNTKKFAVMTIKAFNKY